LTELEVAVQAAQQIDLTSDQARANFVELLRESDDPVLWGLLEKFGNTSKVAAVLAGRVVYEIRLRTQDGEWGRTLYKMAEQSGVSERTLRRWMVAAQEHFELEFTAAQLNARVPSSTDERPLDSPPDVDGGFDWDDEDEAAEAGFAGLDDGPLLDRMNAEAGWGDDTLPPVQHGDERAPSVTPNPMLLEPDNTWVAFTAQSIMQEHEGFSDVAAERSAKARWARKLEQDPLDLLEELEMIYEAQGETLTDEMVIKLHEADDQKALVPDEVTEPGEKKKRGKGGPKPVHAQAEKLLGMVRDLHGQVHAGLTDGTVNDKEVAAMWPFLAPIPHTLANLKNMADAAKARQLKDNPPMEQKIAATVAAEETTETEADF
jgi:hypothetical protein